MIPIKKAAIAICYRGRFPAK